MWVCGCARGLGRGSSLQRSKPAARLSSELRRALPLSLWAKQTFREQLRRTSYSLSPSREPAFSRPAKSQKRYGSLSITGKERQEEGTWGEGRSVLLVRKHWKHRRRKLSTQGYSQGAMPCSLSLINSQPIALVYTIVVEPGDLGMFMRSSHPPSGRADRKGYEVRVGRRVGVLSLSRSFTVNSYPRNVSHPPILG